MKRSVFTKLTVWTGVILMAGCTSLPSHEVADTEKTMQYPGRELDYIAKSLDEFGSLTIAGSTLLEPDPNFKFDLNMTAKEMFDRPRVEGFSTLLQQDSLDFQLSVEAQIVKNMLQDTGSGLSGVESSLLAQNLQAAAWRGLLSQIPGGEQLAAALQQPEDTNTSAGPAAGDGFVGDGGQAAVSEARLACTQASNHFAEIGKQCGIIKAAGVSEDNAKTALAVLFQEADAYHASTAEALSAIDLAAREALRLAATADARINTAPTDAQKNILTYQTLVTTAKDAAARAVGMAKALSTSLGTQKTKYANDVKTMSDSTVAEIQALGTQAGTVLIDLTATEGEDTYTVSNALEQAETASTNAVGAARAVQVPVTPSVPILEADEIPKDKRLALGRLLAPDKGLPILNDPTGGLTQNLRQLLLDTASDDMTYNMLRWLSYPESFGPGKRVYLCMTTVSCMPGYRATKGFRGQIDLFLDLARVRKGYNGKEEIVLTNAQPLVFSAYPLVGTQLLDLRTSRRQVFSTAMQLVVTGYPAAARALLDFASDRQQNVETLSGINTVTSFGSGNHVGFTFSPQLQAQADPSRINTKPEWILQPETFPAVILIVVDERDLITSDPDNGANTLIWRHSFRWMPTTKGNSGSIGKPVFSESELGRRAECLEGAYHALHDGGIADDGWPTSFAAETLNKRIEYFKTMALGKDVYMTLPLFTYDDPTGADGDITVYPEHVWTDVATTLYVTVPSTWMNFLDITVAGKNVNSSRLSSTLVRVSVPPLGDSASPDIPTKTATGTRIPPNGANSETAAKHTDLVVVNGTRAVSKQLTYGRLNEPAPKKEDEPTVMEKLTPGGIARTQYVGYIDPPDLLRFDELNVGKRFSFKLYEELKDSKGKSITKGVLVFRLLKDPTKFVEVDATIKGKDLVQAKDFTCTAANTYTPSGVGALVINEPVQVTLKYIDDNAHDVEKHMAGFVFLHP